MTELNPLIHSQLRLAILSILASVEEADFMYIKQKTDATMGNLSVQITKLEEAGYIEVDKTFQGKRPRTVCKMTEKGKEAFLQYVTALQEYIAPALIEERNVKIESEKDSVIPKDGLALC